MRQCLAIWILVAVSACGAVEPYIFQPGEFDRTRADYGKEPADIASVSVCYLGAVTAFEEVIEMAEERCGQFAKEAVLRDSGYARCPLVTPAHAAFDCVSPGVVTPLGGRTAGVESDEEAAKPLMPESLEPARELRYP